MRVGPTRRRALGLVTGAGAMLAMPAIVRAQPRPYTIYQMTYRGETDVERGFRDFLRSRDVPVEIIMRNAEGDAGRVPEFVAEARALDADLVYTWGTPITIAALGRDGAVDAADHITERPAVFTMVSAPVLSGVVPTFESSGRNITGVFHIVPMEAQLRLMRSYRPFDTLGVIYTPNEQNSVTQVELLRELAQRDGFRLVERAFPLGPDGTPDGSVLEQFVADLKAEHADWFMRLPDTFLGTLYERMREAIIEHQLPTFGTTEQAIRTGAAVAALVCRYYSVGQLTALKAEQILVGKRDPATIPIETLSRFSLIIDIELAKKLNVIPPLGMLTYAEIIAS